MNDLRFALRSLRNQPVFAVVAVLTLALGIGATTTLFTIVNAVLLRPLPYPEASRIVSISESREGKDQQVVPAPDYLDWARSAHSFDRLAEYGPTSAVLTGRGEPAWLRGAMVSAEFFSVFSAQPAFGRGFGSEETVPNGPHVVVLAHELWRQRFGADRAVLGRTISLDGKPYTVIGVMPAGFAFPRGTQYWLPDQRDLAPRRGVLWFLQVVARLRPAVSLASAQGELSALNRRVGALMATPTGPSGAAREARVLTLHERIFGSTRPALLMLLGAVGFLLLIACANVANLLLARATARQREFAVRVALGGSRWKLARELLWESVLMGLAGGALGLLIPVWSLAYFVHISPASVAHVERIQLDGTVLAFAIGISLLTSILFGALPAFTATRPQALDALKEGGARATGGATQRRMREALVVAELAIALVLLTGAGLLTRSFVQALTVDVGFDPQNVVTVRMDLARSRYPDGQSATAFFERVAARVRALPDVRSVGFTAAPPLAGYMEVVRFPLAAGNEMSPPFAVSQTSAGYLKAFGARLLEGRLFTDADRAGAPSVVVLSASAAQAIFHGGPAVGQTLPAGPWPGHQTVVGIVHDMQEPGSDVPRLPQIYQPMAQVPSRPAVLAVRFAGAAGPLEDAVQRIVAGVDPLQPVYEMSTMQQELDRIVAPRRFNSFIIDVFAVLALVLAAVGLYGVVAYQVSQRTRELGIRVALGADRSRLMRFVLREGMAPALLGVVCGLALSLALSRLLGSMLFGVTTHDPLTFTVGPVLLLVVAAGASLVPARRAARVDPVEALRYE